MENLQREASNILSISVLHLKPATIHEIGINKEYSTKRTTDPNFAGEESILFSSPNQYSTNWDLYQQNGRLLDTDPLGFESNTSPVEGSATTVSVPVSDPSMEDTDFSETFKFISDILMEENVEQRPFYDPLSLQVTEKSFYHAMIDKIPLSPNEHPLLDTHSPDGVNGTTSINNNSSIDDFLHEIFCESKPPSPDAPVSVLSNHAALKLNSHAISHTSSQPLSTDVSDGLIGLDSTITNLMAQNIFSDADAVSQFKRGLEEANKFLPPQPFLLTGLEPSNSNMLGKKSFGLQGRKNHDREESNVKEEGRSNKQSAVGIVVDEEDLSKMFDKILLNVENLPLFAELEQPLSSSEGGKTLGRSKKQRGKKETIDLSTLLLLCSQAVYTNDNRTANELFKQIRQHSSPFGDGSQRLAHYFANGLEARLVGDGTDAAQTFYSCPSSKRITAAEFLKSSQVNLSTIPFKKFAYVYANKMIYKAAEKAETLHIIDFGILYGFQWPILIKFLSNREGGPPKLRITGIEFPSPGFRPTEQNEETGRCLANYCKRFGVPFEYNAIASRNWETIKVEDLKIDSNEVVAVNCTMRFKNLLDETIEVNSPRNAVLHLIRKINPDIFTHSIVNGSHNSPFFAPRFREALFRFSTIYDMFDTVLPRESEWRMTIEREIVGREAMNVIACEGFERVERPETYRQWQVRITRAGFKQLPLDREMMNSFRIKLREWDHKEFVFDEDNNWMLLGWKGRVLYASTCWVPATENSHSQHKN